MKNQLLGVLLGAALLSMVGWHWHLAGASLADGWRWHLASASLLHWRDASATPAARAAAVAPFLDEQTIAVARVDLARLNVEAWFDRAIPVLPDQKDELVATKAAAQAAAQSLLRAGAKEAYGVCTLALGLKPGPLFAVIPLRPGSDEKAIRAVLAGNGRVFQRLGDVLLMADSREALARIAGMAPDPRPELAAAFEAAGDTALQAVLLPPKHYKRVIEEIVPEIPPQFGGGSNKIVTQGLLWAAIGIDSQPQVTVRLVIQSQDAQAAEKLRAKLIETAGLLGKIKEVREAVPKLAEVTALLTPKAEGDRLTVVLDEKNQGAAKLLALLAPPSELLRARVARGKSIDNLKLIALAMHSYHDVGRHFPLPASRGKDKKTLLSWRVLVLPYLDQEGLYRQFHLDEAWDSPHNRTLIDKMPAVYRLPFSKAKKGYTNYLLPVGHGAAFSPDCATAVKDITDGTSNTIMVVEVDDERAAVWTRPDDWPFDPKDPAQGLGRVSGGGFTAAFCDGYVRWIASPKTPDEVNRLRTLFTRAGGEVVSWK